MNNSAILLKYPIFEVGFIHIFSVEWAHLFHGQNNCKVTVSANCRVRTKSWLKKLENCKFCLISILFVVKIGLNVDNSLYIFKKEERSRFLILDTNLWVARSCAPNSMAGGPVLKLVGTSKF